MSDVREDLIHLIGELPEEKVRTLLATARALDSRQAHGRRQRPPGFFGSIRHASNGRTDNASRVDEVLAESGLGRDLRANQRPGEAGAPVPLDQEVIRHDG